MMYVLVWLMFWHWVSDFLLQPREMVDTKSSSLTMLGGHGIIYLLGTLLGAVALCAWYPALRNDINSGGILCGFATVNAVAHLVIDFFTSKVNKQFYSEDKMWQMFTTIGFDQFLHISILIITAFWLLARFIM